MPNDILVETVHKELRGHGALFDGVVLSSIKTEFLFPGKGLLSDQVETNPDKAVCGKPLSYWQKIRNKYISFVRCGIERIFGTFKRCRDFARSRYVGLAKVEQNFFLVALSYNLVRARTLITACLARRKPLVNFDKIMPPVLLLVAEHEEEGTEPVLHRRLAVAKAPVC